MASNCHRFGGFFYVAFNNGLSKKISGYLQTCYLNSHEFFSKPLDENMKVFREDVDHGYKRAGIESFEAYCLRTVLHDWPDKEAIDILSRIREAMIPDSLLLINEKAMPDTNIPWMAAIGAMSMMPAFSSAERTKNEWESVLNKAGFKLNRVWKPEGTDAQQQVIIEGALLSLE